MIDELFELQKILLDRFKQQPLYQRAVFEEVKLDNRVTGILGTRGVGKTTFLLHTVLQKNQKRNEALYISADHVYFLKNKLIDLVDELYKKTDVRLLCVDEIHKYVNWQQELKNISDFYLDFKVVFTGSSMIDIIHSKFDLSRRVTLYHLHGFSFREYLEFTLDVQLPRFTLEEMLHQSQEVINQIDVPGILKHFHQYLREGYFPFAKQFSERLLLYQSIENIVQKTIYEDIATLHAMKTSSLLIIEKLYQYVINSQPGELSAYKLASALSKDYESVSSYLHYLEQSGLLRALYKKQSGKAYLRNPTKLYPENPNYIYAACLSQPSDALIGKVRENFALCQLQNAGLTVYFSEVGDFKVEDKVFEVGGKSKTRQQLKGCKNGYVLADDRLTCADGVLPLFLLGFLV